MKYPKYLCYCSWIGQHYIHFINFVWLLSSFFVVRECRMSPHRSFSIYLYCLVGFHFKIGCALWWWWFTHKMIYSAVCGWNPKRFSAFLKISCWLWDTPSKYYYLYLMDNLNILYYGLFIFNALKRRFFGACALWFLHRPFVSMMLVPFWS